MDDVILDFLNFRYNVLDDNDTDGLVRTCRALASRERIMILQFLYDRNYTVRELAEACFMTVSSVEFHVRVLEEAGLVETSYQPSKKGKIKVCTRHFVQLLAYFGEVKPKSDTSHVTMEIPVGLYSDADLQFVSGMVTDTEQFMFDDGNYFLPERKDAGLLWCSNGYVTYRFNNPRYAGEVGAIRISLEICSEALGYNMNWKSDITFSLCGKELCTYTSPGDYGDRPGLLSPRWWSERTSANTHYGDLKTIYIDGSGVYLDGVSVTHEVTSEDFSGERTFVLKIENKRNAENVGGFNLFGKNYGDYPQDIRIELL